MLVVEELRKADAAGIGIKDKDRRVEFIDARAVGTACRLRPAAGERGNDAAGFSLADEPLAGLVAERPVNVVRIRHQKHGRQVLERVSQRRKPVDHFRRREIERPQPVARNRKPVAGRVHVLFRKIHVPVAQIFRGVKFDLLVAHHLANDLHLAVLHNRAAGPVMIERIDDAHVGVRHGVGVIVRVHPPDVGLLSLQVQSVHMVLFGGQHVDGLIVDGGEGAVPVHFGDDFVIARVGRIDDHDVFRVDGAQADLVGRIAFRRPVPAVAALVQDAFFFKVLQKLLQVFAAEFFALFKRQFKRRALDVMEKDQQVIRIDPAVFGR